MPGIEHDFWLVGGKRHVGDQPCAAAQHRAIVAGRGEDLDRLLDGARYAIFEAMPDHVRPRCSRSMTISGLQGIRSRRRPSSPSASATALATTAMAPTRPDSPAPLMPSG